MRDLILVIDMQNVYAPGGTWYCKNIRTAAENICMLLEHLPEDTEVAFTKFLAEKQPEGVWAEYNKMNAAVNEDDFANAYMEVFEPYLQKYPCFTKSRYSALCIEELQTMLHKVDRVVVTGVVAECCVLATVMSLIDAGIPIVYLTDAVAGIDDATEKATELILSGLEPLHVRRMTSDMYLEGKRKNSNETF